jgi:hypothetical protein
VEEVQLIDFADDFDVIAKEATRKRLDDYRGQPWEINDLPYWLQDAGKKGDRSHELAPEGQHSGEFLNTRDPRPRRAIYEEHSTARGAAITAS